MEYRKTDLWFLQADAEIIHFTFAHLLCYNFVLKYCTT